MTLGDFLSTIPALYTLNLLIVDDLIGVDSSIIDLIGKF
jgi:hypothetical protein